MLSCAGLCVAAMAWTVAAQASQGGRSGFSGDPTTNAGANCSVCHVPGGAQTPTINIVGPQVMDAGTTRDFFVVMTGGPAQSAGVDIAAQNAVGQLLPVDGDLQEMHGELTHTGPKPFGSNLVTFIFRYTAPNYDAEVTLHAAGNSTNGAHDLLGDGIDTTTLDITVQNGFESPPEPPAPPGGELDATLYASGFSQPVAIENAGDKRLFVVERAGVIRIIKRDGTVLPTPFLDIASRVDDTGGEMGLLGLAFHPDYENNGYFYVNYTRDPGPGLDRTRVSRFSVSSDRNVADANSEQVLMEFEQPFANHNGGDLHFGPSGYLHIAVGDGGSGGDPQNNGQKTNTLLGKMLRIDVDTPATPGAGPDCSISAGTHYSIPPGNAYNDGIGGGGCDEIFALGLRNPWRFAFDSVTGAMWIADVGQNKYEEVSYLPPGGSGGINLGWRCYEGTEPYNLDNCDRVYLPPVHTYDHETSGCSITGGRVYRGAASPNLQGQYFFSDFCQSSIRALSGSPGNLSHRVVLPTGRLSGVSTFGENYLGDLYVAELNTGNIYRLHEPLPPGC
ncbi:MAG: PQQ-dependent sugar dehydrogenase [Halioglobus sp.]